MSEAAFPSAVDPGVDQNRRTWIAITCGAGAIGGVAAAVPFVSTFEPSARARAAGAPVEVDISTLKPGEKITVAWRGKPVWIMRRTPEQVAALPKHDDELADPKSLRNPDEFTPAFARNDWRSLKPEFLVLVGICTHLGCVPGDKFQPGAQPSLPADWPGGFLCPCHGSTFDLAGRVFKNKPAPDNLVVPPYYFPTETTLMIGEEKPA
ncbi:MAG: ubiquinol-cytochrome c reductase iron-sulfur subunit [Burkholderiales bacterium]|nr:ubiquinol-cytochrome c reductase iron-sulfur subunit [Burkholderiales bacterium]